MSDNNIFGCWRTLEDIRADFCDGYWGDETPSPVPADLDVVFASYGHESYEGYAIVIFKRDGKLFEVNGSHCSCYGLEDQWSPEETTVEALERTVIGNLKYGHDVDAIIAWGHILTGLKKEALAA